MDAILLYEHLDREHTIAALKEKHPSLAFEDEAEIAQMMDLLDALKQEGKLYSQDSFAGFTSNLAQADSPVKAICLHVAHACNMGCSYCFAGQGNYQGPSALMSLETGKKALDFLVASSGKRRNLEVDFFGGEPLLNWEVVKGLVAYGRSLEEQHGKVFRFTLTTNGLLLDQDIMDFCNKEMQNVVLSLDGREEVHDRFRVDRQGGGSYASIVPKFQDFAKQRKGKGYYLRGTFTGHNPDFFQDILHMAELGFTQLSMEPVVGVKEGPSALNQGHLPIIFEQYEQLALEMLKRKKAGNGFDFYHFTLDLQKGPCAHKRLAGCGSGTEYLAITPEGDLYPCHQFVGQKEYQLGTLKEGITKPGLRLQFSQNTLYSKQACRECWAKFFCAGGCAANAAHETGQISGIHEFSCSIFKKRLECAIVLQAGLAEDQ